MARSSCEQRDIDRYGHTVAICFAGGDDLGAWLVENGWALAFRQYSAAYVAQERAAESARRGMWRGEFVPPWDWRKGAR
jgi:endonuclease YncB( thermonuclease family)